MIIYYVLFAFLLGSLFICADRTLNNTYTLFRKYYYAFCVLILTILACVRGPYVGVDTSQYIKIYNRILGVPWNGIIRFSVTSGTEIGYVVYNKLLSLLSTNGQIVTVGNSLLLMLLAGKLMSRECRNPIYALFIFYAIGMYQSSFNIVSSMIASYMVYSGIDFIRKRKLLKYLLCILVAALFHNASIILIPLYFLYKIKLDFKRIVLVLGAGFLAAVLLIRAYNILLYFIPVRYAGYLQRESDNGMVLVFHSLIMLVILVVQLASAGNLKAFNDEELRVHSWAFLLDIVLLTLALRINIFTRAAFMFMPSIPIFIDRLTGKISVKNNRALLYTGLAFATGLQYILRLQINNIGGSAPYYFFWNA